MPHSLHMQKSMAGLRLACVKLKALPTLGTIAANIAKIAIYLLAVLFI